MMMARNGLRADASIVFVIMVKVLVLLPCVWTHLMINSEHYDQEEGEFFSFLSLMFLCLLWKTRVHFLLSCCGV